MQDRPAVDFGPLVAAERRKVRNRKRQSGFTLIELLLSLSILSIIMVAILGAMRMGVRAWEKGEEVLSVQQRSRTVLDQLNRQLACAAVLMSAQAEEPLVRFAGESDSVEFASTLPLIAKTRYAPVYVKYAVESGRSGKKRLILYEKDITPADYLSEGPMEQDADALVLIGELEDLRFEYLGDPSDGPDLNWTSAWQPRTPTDLPRAVRITYRDDMEQYAVQVIARLNLSDRFRENI